MLICVKDLCINYKFRMKFTIITLFPEMFSSLEMSILKRAKEKGLIDINFVNLRDFAKDKHKTVDDTPYGGGKGMVLKVDVMDRAISDIKNKISKTGVILSNAKNPTALSFRTSEKSPVLQRDPSLPQDDSEFSRDGKTRIILMTPKGNRFNQDKVRELAKYDNIVLICGHYEGFDERIRDLVDEEISIGDFVLTGGEIPAMAVVDSVARLVPGVLSENSADSESFMEKNELGNYLLEAPQYTRPEKYKSKKVPAVLLSGNHAKIAKWRKKQQKISS